MVREDKGPLNEEYNFILKRKKTKKLLGTLESDPFHNPSPYEKLVGDLSRAYSRRINFQHRLVYEVFQIKKTVRVLRMWTHYE